MHSYKMQKKAAIHANRKFTNSEWTNKNDDNEREVNEKNPRNTQIKHVFYSMYMMIILSG